MGAYEDFVAEEAKELGVQRGVKHREANPGCSGQCPPDYPALLLDTDYFYDNETPENNRREERAELRRVFAEVWDQAAHPGQINREETPPSADT